MGTAQSSHADRHHHHHQKKSAITTKDESKMIRVGGRKALKEQGMVEEAPHGLVGSFVSEPSTMLVLGMEDPSETMIMMEEEEDDHEEDHYLVAVEEEEEDEVTVTSYSSSEGGEESEEEDEEEEEEEWEERLRILEEAQQLKQVATFFLRPELPVVSEYGVTASCVFDRWSMEDPVPTEEDDEAQVERELVMEEMQALKDHALAYHHPESAVVVSDATVCARNYFTRPSAPEQTLVEDEKEAMQVLKDCQALQQHAQAYLHPEVTVSSSVAVTRGVVVESDWENADEALEREQIMRDLALLKTTAVMYLHPEAPVTVDPTCLGRSYFNRPSASEYEEEEVDVERDDILADVQTLKDLAKVYLHPEESVLVDATASGRNYFARASAPEYQEVEDDLERDYLLQDVEALKMAARQYLHPEIKVPKSSVAVSKAHAYEPQHEDADEEERDQILRDMALLKQTAHMYLHPEAPVEVHPMCMGRNYYTRAGAPEYEDEEIDADRDDVLADVYALKQSAQMYLHPELPMQQDATATGRNYYSRPSAQEYQEVEDDLERDYLLQDVAALKMAAQQYLHPEIGVHSSVAMARNYFSRPFAEPTDDIEDDLERDYILADVQVLKASAAAFHHPEVGIKSSAGVTRGHNYDYNLHKEMEEERATILAELKQLKASAMQFRHPEEPIVVSPEAMGRNYFTRASADAYETKEQVEERAQAVEDAVMLKSLATQYHHPEAPLAVDPAVFGRSYFGRPSAEQPEDSEDIEDESHERELILAEAKALKKLAIDYLHPEVALVDSIAGGRNYFNRPSSHVHDQMIHTFPAHEDDWHHDDYSDHHHEHLDHFGMDEEMEARFDDLRQNLPKIVSGSSNANNKAKNNNRSNGSEEEGGNLSRSPSSVMLFTDESIYD